MEISKRWWPRNLKHHNLNQFYHEYDWPKIWYSTYLWRVLRYWYDKEIAIQKYIKLIWKSLIKWEVTRDGRNCTKCGEYKLWLHFTKNKEWPKWYDSKCRNCKKILKKEYRDKTNRQKDNEYRKNKRKLEIWKYIHLWIIQIDWVIQPMEYRKVVDKKKMQSYKLQSMTTWYFCRLDTTEWNPNYKKFYHVDNLTISKAMKAQY